MCDKTHISLALFVLLAFLIPNTPAQSACGEMSLKQQFLHSETGDIPIYRAGNTISFVSQMQVNTDGAPDSYHPDNIGITHICNGISVGSDCGWKSDCLTDFFRARSEGFIGLTKICFFGMAADLRGVPLLQKDDDPKPGYYVSTTALKQPGLPANTQRAQLDSNEISFIVIPRNWQTEKYEDIQLGDFAYVYRKSNKTFSPAIVGDLGPTRKLGEGSVALHRALGNDPFTIRPDGRRRAYRGISAGDVVYLIFPNSRTTEKLFTVELIKQEAGRLLAEFGGEKCLAEISASK